MKTSGMLTVAIAALLQVAIAFGPPTAVAQSTTPVQTPALETTPSTVTTEQPTPNRKPDQARLDALKAKIEHLKYERIKTALEMDDAEAAKFFAVYKPAEQEIMELARQRNDALKQLRDLSTGGKTDADVDPVLTRIRDLTTQIEQRQVTLDQSLKPILTPRQRARLLVFEQEFNHRLRNQIAKRQFLNNHPQLKQRVRQFRLRQLQKRLKHR